MPSAMAELPDANVWLALAWDGHVAHPVARAWWESAAPGSVSFCRVSQMALLRLLTNASVMGKDFKTQAEAWEIYDALRQSARMSFAEEPPAFETQWRKLSTRDTAATKRWTDDYLAALAMASALSVVTFDEGFRSYPNLPVKLLVVPNLPASPVS